MSHVTFPGSRRARVAAVAAVSAAACFAVPPAAAVPAGTLAFTGSGAVSPALNVKPQDTRWTVRGTVQGAVSVLGRVTDGAGSCVITADGRESYTNGDGLGSLDCDGAPGLLGNPDWRWTLRCYGSFKSAGLTWHTYLTCTGSIRRTNGDVVATESGVAHGVFRFAPDPRSQLSTYVVTGSVVLAPR